MWSLLDDVSRGSALQEAAPKHTASRSPRPRAWLGSTVHLERGGRMAWWGAVAHPCLPVGEARTCSRGSGAQRRGGSGTRPPPPRAGHHLLEPLTPGADAAELPSVILGRCVPRALPEPVGSQGA